MTPTALITSGGVPIPSSDDLAAFRGIINSLAISAGIWAAIGAAVLFIRVPPALP